MDNNKPKAVKTGVSILYFSLILGFLMSVINIIRVSYGIVDINLQTKLPVPLTWWMMFIVLAVSTFIIWLLIHCISKGQSWARIVYLVIIVVILLSWAVNFNQVLNQGVFALIGGIINTALGVVGMAYLLSPSANAWFRSNKSS